MFSHNIPGHCCWRSRGRRNGVNIFGQCRRFGRGGRFTYHFQNSQVRETLIVGTSAVYYGGGNSSVLRVRQKNGDGFFALAVSQNAVVSSPTISVTTHWMQPFRIFYGFLLHSPNKRRSRFPEIFRYHRPVHSVTLQKEHPFVSFEHVLGFIYDTGLLSQL